MKMFLLTILLTTISLRCIAPEYRAIDIVQSRVINFYDPLIVAVIHVESRGNVYAFNFLEQAVGPMQIRPCRVNHYNKLTKSNYSLKDCFSFELSRKIFLYFAQGKTYEKAARDWNGSGPMTLIYWQKIKEQL